MSEGVVMDDWFWMAWIHRIGWFNDGDDTFYSYIIFTETRVFDGFTKCSILR